MPIPDIATLGDTGHIQDHNDIIGVLSDHASSILLKAPLASPTFTGIPVAPTASPGTNTTQIATTAFVQASVSSGGGSYQPLDSDLTAIAGLTGTSGLLRKTASDTWSLDTATYAPINQNMFIGTTQIPINRTSGALTLSGVSIDGNAGTVTNGVVTTGSYVDPSWISSLSKSKVGLANVENTAISTWAGSSNVTTLGTISTGTWDATNISLNKGGTNSSLTAVNGGVVYSTDTALAITSSGTSGQVLTSNGSSPPTWQTPASSGTTMFASATIRATWTGTLPPYQDGATGTVMTVTLPVGRFTQAPIVSCQEMNITHGGVTGDNYFDVLPYSVSTSSIGLWVQNNGPRIAVSGGRNITGGVVDVWAVQMTSGSSLG